MVGGGVWFLLFWLIHGEWLGLVACCFRWLMLGSEWIRLFVILIR